MYSKIEKIQRDRFVKGDPSSQLVVNHLENIRGITTKTGLIRTLKQYYKDNHEACKIVSKTNTYS